MYISSFNFTSTMHIFLKDLIDIFQLQPKEIRVKITEVTPKPQSVNLPIPLATTEEFEASDAGDPVFQFSPEFHRVPSPILSTPHVTILPSADDQASSLAYDEAANSIDTHDQQKVGDSVIPQKDVSAVSACQGDASGSRSNIVSARAKFFEQEIQQQQLPSKPTNGKHPSG